MGDVAFDILVVYQISHDTLDFIQGELLAEQMKHRFQFAQFKLRAPSLQLMNPFDEVPVYERLGLLEDKIRAHTNEDVQKSLESRVELAEISRPHGCRQLLELGELVLLE